MTKKKGQKWGTEKAGLSKRYAQHMNEDTYQTETVAKGHIGPNLYLQSTLLDAQSHLIGHLHFAV